MTDIFDIALGRETVSEEAPAKGIEEQPWWKAVSADVLKGLVEGTVRLGRMMGPTRQRPGEEEFTMERFSEQLEELIPSRETSTGAALRRGMGTLPSAVTTPGVGAAGQAARALAGGVLGEAVKEAGYGEVPQAIAELAPFITPSGPSGILPRPTKVQESLASRRMVPEKLRESAKKSLEERRQFNELLKFAQERGLTPEEITPLFQPKGKTTAFSTIATRGDATQQRLERSKQAIDSIADSFKLGQKAEVVLSDSSATSMTNKIQDILYDMPAKTRNVIQEDFQQLLNSPKDTKSIIKFFRDINAQYGQNKKQLGRLKEPLMEGLSTIDPQLAKDFNLTNKLFQKYYDISSKLKPNIVDQILTASKGPKVIYGAITGNYPLIAEAITEDAARKLAAYALTSPKLQNISKKMVNAINKEKFVLADRIKQDYIRTIKDDFPQAAAEMEKESFKQFLEL